MTGLLAPDDNERMTLDELAAWAATLARASVGTCMYCQTPLIAGRHVCDACDQAASRAIARSCDRSIEAARFQPRRRSASEEAVRS